MVLVHESLASAIERIRICLVIHYLDPAVHECANSLDEIADRKDVIITEDLSDFHYQGIEVSELARSLELSCSAAASCTCKKAYEAQQQGLPRGWRDSDPGERIHGIGGRGARWHTRRDHHACVHQ